MNTKEDLRRILTRIDGRGYKAYKDIKGVYRFEAFDLFIDHVQGDPFAAPSRARARVPLDRAGFPSSLYGKRIRKIAFGDYIARQFRRALEGVVKGHRGMGKSGLIDIDSGGQEILERNAVALDDQHLEARFVVGLPAMGRTILGREAMDIFFREVPLLVDKALFYRNHDPSRVKDHVEAAEDQDYLRGMLPEKGLVAFIGDGAILPRRSGVDDRPLERNAIPFRSPGELGVEFELPNRGHVMGMGVPAGVTLIVGGGFHGKSTLLNGIERGVYNHIPGDGREMVVTHPGAVKIRSEDGRNIEKVNISPFINNLPLGKDTVRFSTENASGSTSQAANIMEFLEVGATVLLIDEDTSATNFMVRDERMQELVAKEKEPITPFVDKVQKLYRDLKVSTILVMGGSGDYFDVVDMVIMMDGYRPRCVTQAAKEIAQRHATKRIDEGGSIFGEVTPRRPRIESFDPSRGRKEVKIEAKGLRTILYGRTPIDLSYLEQLVDTSQTRSIGLFIHYYAQHYIHKGLPLRDALERCFQDLEGKGLDMLLPYRVGNLARPRIFEVAGAINRMRTLKIDGFVKSPTSALRCILRHCSVL
jgi:predicted ABC-class ATPase